MNEPHAPALRFWSHFARAYGFALLVALVAVVPGCNFLYSGHGGPLWFLLPLGLPYAMIRVTIWLLRARADREFHVQFAVRSLFFYLLSAAPISVAATASIEATFGLQVSPWAFYGYMTLPLSLPFLLAA